MTIDDFRTLFAYDRWATSQLLEVAAALPQDHATRRIGGSFGSLLGIAVHMVGASWIWLERFQGRSPTRFDGDEALSSIAAARERAEEVGAGLQAFVEGLTPESLGTSISYRSLKGDPFTMPLDGLLQHLVNHGTYHRGQISMGLRLLGAGSVPSTDFVLYQRTLLAR